MASPDYAASNAGGVQKAAALLLSLGVDLSSKVLQHLDESDLELVMEALSQAGSVPPEVRRAALSEAYAFSTGEGGGRVGGAEFTRQLLARTLGPHRAAEVLERINAHQQNPSFEILHNADPVQVASLLSEEHPQTIALVLSYLDTKLAAEILTHMPQDLQLEVTLRLATMDRVSPQVIQTVEHGLKSKLAGVINEADFRATGGVSFLVQLLNQVDRGVQKTILESLEPANPKLVEEIRASMFTFDDLVKLDDRALQRLLRDVNKQDLALALKAAPEKVKEAIYRNLSERARETLQEELEILGPQLAKNVYAAQRRIVDIVRALEEAEEIVIAGGGEGYEIIP